MGEARFGVAQVASRFEGSDYSDVVMSDRPIWRGMRLRRALDSLNDGFLIVLARRHIPRRDPAL